MSGVNRRQFKRNFVIYFIVLVLSNTVFFITRNGVLRAYGIEPLEFSYLEIGQRFPFYATAMIVASAGISALLSLTDLYVIPRIMHARSFLLTLLSTFLVNFGLMLAFVYVFDNVIHRYFEHLNGGDTIRVNRAELAISMIQLFSAMIISRILIEIDRKLGPGNLWKFILGRFYNPREEDRIFMFIDLKGSTTIAEKLGHFQYSKLLRDSFQDLAVVDQYHAAVYQYVGDEVVLSWSAKKKKNFGRIIPAFLEFQRRINSRKDYYIKNYGLVPEFKAGAHVGPAIISEVGTIKREITYHGDTLNTTSRIQDQCNVFESHLLVSSDLHRVMHEESPYEFVTGGHIELKGKKKKVEIFKVKNEFDVVA
ncbi:MAG: adenylate/guanylate cyclase domain-containing protein [Flavobacteriales bacterium]|nr:adenylate/guanylate cyclase domain-containing protein [Flavobacteriales bacterium]